MMGHREKLKSGDEYDCVSISWRKVIIKRAGKMKAIKKKMSKRSRRTSKKELGCASRS